MVSKQKITAQQAGEIAGKFLGGMNPKYANIKLVNLNGNRDLPGNIFRVIKSISFLLISPDTVIKAQVLSIHSAGGGGGGGDHRLEHPRDDDHEEMTMMINLR